MEYIKLFMEFEIEEQPVVYFFEVDLSNERLAARAIEVLANRQVDCITDLYEGVIEITPIPTVEEFSTNVWGEGFFAQSIPQEEFETIWNTKQYTGPLTPDGKMVLL